MAHFSQFCINLYLIKRLFVSSSWYLCSKISCNPRVH